MRNSPLKVVDLFCGLGGMSAGIVDACLLNNKKPEIVLALDKDPHASAFYRKNFKNYLNEFIESDIQNLYTEIAPEYFANNNIDLLLAGPPCQGHSNLNNSTRRNDPRNQLYMETIEFIRRAKPLYFIIENVPSVIHASEKVVDIAFEQLAKEGYIVKDINIEFENLGVPQKRKRHVMIGTFSTQSDILNFINESYKKYRPRTVKDAIEDLIGYPQATEFDKPSKMHSINVDRAKYLFVNDLYDLPNNLRPKCHQKKHSYKSMYGRLYWDKPAQTITGGFGSMGQGRFLHPLEPRMITPREAARIQGLPDWLDFSEVNSRTALQQMIGNAVPSVLSFEFANEIIKEIESGKDNKAKIRH